MLKSLRQLVPHYIRRSYALKFAISLLILGLVVMMIGVGATQQVTRDVEDRTLERHEAAAETEAGVIESIHQQNRRYADMAVETRLLQEYQLESEGRDDEDVQRYLTQWRQELPNYVEEMHFVDINNKEIIATSAEDGESSPQSLDDVGLPSSVNLRVVGEVEVYATAPYTKGDGENGTPVMAYIRHVPGSYALVVTVDMSQYAGIYERRKAESSGEDVRQTSIVVDRNDRISITDNTTAFAELYGQDYEDTHGVLQRARTSTARSGALQRDGAPKTLADEPYEFDPDGYVVGWSKLDLENSAVQYDQDSGEGWILLVHTSQDDAYGFVNDVQRNGVIATLFGVLFVVGIGTIVGRNTSASIDRLTEQAEEMERGNLDVEFDTERIDSIGRLYDGFASMRDALQEQIQDAREARTEAERERERVQRINDDLEEAAAEYRDVMGKAADGDLTVRAHTETDNETMETIGEEFNVMLDEIERTVEQLKRFAGDVAAASQQVTASSQEVSAASENVSNSTEEISEGARRQNESLQSVNQEMSGLSTTIQQIASSSNEVADIAARTAKTGKRGRTAAANALETMDQIRTDSEAAVEEIAQLEEEVEQIDELIEYITDIAEQTNMLALNANIEAARSTDAEGDGFGVVAEEVKELSEDTKEAAEEIEQRLESIREQTKRSATEVERTGENIVEQTDAVEEATTALEEIAGYAQQTNAGVQEISAATEQQAASTQEVVSMIDHAASISEKTTSEAEEVAAAAKQQTEALTEVSASATQLADQASQLSEALDRFDTEVNEDELGDFVVLDGETDDTDGGFPGDNRAVVRAGSDDESELTFQTPDVSLDEDDDRHTAPDGSGDPPAE